MKTKQLWVALGLALSIGWLQAYGSPLEQIKDPALKACIQAALSKQGATGVEQITKLKCHNQGIESLDGIQQLINLESLSLFNNRIEEADLTQLNRLEMLNLANNDLVSLQISGLGELKTLFLFKNNLTSINMQGLVSLQKLRMMQNQLTVLDITSLVSLREAHLFDNQLEDLQITGLSKLEYLDVKQNPMPDELYDFYDEQTGIVISHDGNADDWQ
ncbi:MAG: hypothetical protein Alis3KO_15750 [Aliiglaciecola sp.]